MPRLDKANRRDIKRRKKRFGMRRDGDSVKTIQRILTKKKDIAIKNAIKRKKERMEFDE